MKNMEFYISLLSVTTVYGIHLTINWTQVRTVPLGWETYLDHPPGVPLAPCSCDLISSFCDLSCCCDRDCTTISINPASCLSPTTPDQEEESVATYTCKYLGPFSPEWHSFFCPVKENTPYLGLFYPLYHIIKDYEKYMARVRQQYYSYQEEGVHVPDLEYIPHYVHEEQMLMGKDIGGTVIEGPLLLPQPVLEGVCVDTFPVHFLKDLSHKCIIIMSPKKCVLETALSVASYLQPSDAAASDPTSGFLQVIGNLSSFNLVNATVEYKWMEDITKFIKVQGGSIPTALTQNAAATLEESNLPYFDVKTGLCNNVVLAVQYQLAWEGPVIVDIAATITLGNVPVLPEPQEDVCPFREQNLTCSTPPAPRLPPFSATSQLLLLQHFMVKFHHIHTSSNVADNISDLYLVPEVDDIGVLGLSERSGNPGYLIHRPLLAGYVIYNSTEENSTINSLLSVALNDSTGFYVWRPDESGSCHTSYLEKVAFGIDVISSCLYPWSDVSCFDLKEMLEGALYSLVQAEVVSTFGWPNISKEEDFVPIIFGQHKENKTSGSGCDVPSSLEYRIIYQDVLDESSPTHAVYQVVGVSVRLHYKTLHLHNNTSTGSHLLTSSAVFCHSKPSGLSRFWEAMEDRWCERGICWREILWPWTHGLSKMGLVGDDYESTSLANLLAHSLLGLALSIPPLIVTLTQGFRLML